MSRSCLLAIRLFSCLILAGPAARAGLKTVEGPQGGTIVYGHVESATSQAGAIGFVLRSVHNQCGERPKVGQPFQVRGTRSVAVFFTVTRRAQGDGKAVAGLVIAADGAPGQVEAAFGSFQMNQAVVNQQANAIAAPGLARIKAIGDAAKARSDASNAANERQHAAWNAQQDSQARRNAGFHNYLLDQTVIQDNQKQAHGTVWNATAEALVRQQPDRFELVQTPNFWKGIDY